MSLGRLSRTIIEVKSRASFARREVLCCFFGGERSPLIQLLQLHSGVLQAQGIAHLARGREAHKDATNILALLKGIRRSRRLRRNAGVERTEVAKAHTLTIAEATNHLRLKGIKNGLNVGGIHRAGVANVLGNLVELNGSDSSRTGVVGILLRDGVLAGNEIVLDHGCLKIKEKRVKIKE